MLRCTRSSRAEARGGCSSLQSNCYEEGLVKGIVHDLGCGVPLVRVVICDTDKFKLKEALFLAVVATHTGQV